MAAKTKQASVDELAKLFKEADKDGSGALSRQELKDLLLKGNRNVTDSQLDEVFKFFDSDGGDQKITLEEFRGGLKKIEEFIKGIVKVFKQYDADNSGALDRNELKKILHDSGHKFTDPEVDQILKRADPNGDGKISFEEFIAAFT